MKHLKTIELFSYSADVDNVDEGKLKQFFTGHESDEQK